MSSTHRRAIMAKGILSIRVRFPRGMCERTARKVIADAQGPLVEGNCLEEWCSNLVRNLVAASHTWGGGKVKGKPSYLFRFEFETRGRKKK